MYSKEIDALRLFFRLKEDFVPGDGLQRQDEQQPQPPVHGLRLRRVQDPRHGPQGPAKVGLVSGVLNIQLDPVSLLLGKGRFSDPSHFDVDPDPDPRIHIWV